MWYHDSVFLLFACQDPNPAVSAAEPGPPIFPGPSDTQFDAALAEKALAYDRQFLAINAAPFGLSLDAYPSGTTWIDVWVSAGSGFTRDDFESQTEQDLYALVYQYDEMGDLGMFGGVAAIAEAWRYGLLRDDPGAIEDDIEDARARLTSLLRSLHAMQAVTGRAGSLVRGLGVPGQPGLAEVDLVPFLDEDGNVQPAEKSAVWRTDQSGEFPDFIWMDDTSKDQWIGYCMALGAAWEVAHDDPDIDPAWVEALEADARDMTHALQVPSSETGLDLTLIDGDGRPTSWHDLNASELEGTAFDEPFNPFNAWMALAGLRVLATVGGDDSFYQEVANERGYAELAESVGMVTYFSKLTNYSNVNMAWVSAFNLIHFETDDALLERYARGLESLWGEGTDAAPATFGGAWHAVLYAALTEAEDTVVETALADLAGWPTPPYWNHEIINCDEAEVAAGVCIAIDGVTEIELYGKWEDGTFVPGDTRGGSLSAASLVPMAVRPPSNFEWRSDPYRVNEGGGDRLNPGGDFRAAYWSGRWLRRR